MTAAAEPSTTSALRRELRELARLGGPIAAAQLGLMSLNFVDIAFLGHYDAGALSSMSLGNTLTWAAMVFCMGVMAAVDPLLSQAVGAGDRAGETRALLRGLALATVLALPAALLLLPAPLWLRWFDQKADLIPAASDYARINTLGILPFLWFSVVRSQLSARSRTLAQVVAIALGNVLNAALDAVLVFGLLGLPAFGVQGAAWATVGCRWFMLVVLVGLGRRDVAPHLRAFADRATRAAVLRVGPLLRLLRLGAPIGGQFAMEMGVFAATAMLIGHFDNVADEAGGPRLCGHQIAIQMASLSFMVPLGLGMAASVRVGRATGAGDHPGAVLAARATLLAGATVMSLFMLLFLLLPRELAGILTDDPAALTWAALLIPIAGVFQIGDGLQVTAIGCLRGIGDVHTPFWINVAGFWCFGLPLGCWLAFPWGQDRGPAGLWWGLVAGLFAVAAALLVAVRLRFREARPRLDVE